MFMPIPQTRKVRLKEIRELAEVYAVEENLAPTFGSLTV
jgi:hypothetical protein